MEQDFDSEKKADSLTGIASLIRRQSAFRTVNGESIKERHTVSVTPPTALPAVLAVPEAALPTLSMTIGRARYALSYETDLSLVKSVWEKCYQSWFLEVLRYVEMVRKRKCG